MKLHIDHVVIGRHQSRGCRDISILTHQVGNQEDVIEQDCQLKGGAKLTLKATVSNQLVDMKPHEKDPKAVAAITKVGVLLF